jgi:hypothetical protein
MSKVSYGISFDLGAKIDMLSIVNAKVLPLMSQAVRAVAAQTAADWKTAVYHAKLWSGEKDAYANSITWKSTGDFTAEVEADYKHAAEIETGRPARDLKKMLDTSEKVRRTEDGRRFLVIPMRHNTPGKGAHARPMPQGVYALAKALEPSRVVAAGTRPSGEVTRLSPKSGMHPSPNQSPYLTSTHSKQAAEVVRRQYAWGGRLTAGGLKAAGLDATSAKRYAGMVKMDTSTPGGSKSSSYMTFRIMMDSQTGKWIIPAQPGMFLAKKVADAMQPKATTAFQAAIKKTLSG